MSDNAVGSQPSRDARDGTQARGPAGIRRIVLQIRSSAPNRLALEVAVGLARDLHAELESLFIEDEKLLSLAHLPFATEISFTGRRQRPLAPSVLERELALSAASVRRMMEAMARTAEIMLNFEIVRTRPERALATHCPAGSIVALAEPFTPSQVAVIRRLFARAPDLSGVLLVGPAARRRPGPIVLAVEDIARLPAMLTMARRIAGGGGEQAAPRIVVLLVGDRRASARQMAEEARAILGAGSDIEIVLAEAIRGEAAVIAEALRRVRGSFTLAHIGGLLAPGEGDLKALAMALETPLLLMR